MIVLYNDSRDSELLGDAKRTFKSSARLLYHDGRRPFTLKLARKYISATMGHKEVYAFVAVIPASLSLAISSSTLPTYSTVSDAYFCGTNSSTYLPTADAFGRLCYLDSLQYRSQVNTQVGRSQLLNRLLLRLHNIG